MSKKKEQLLYDHDGRVDVEAIIDERIYNNAPPIKYTAPGRGEQQLACYAVASIRLKGVSSEQAASVMSVLIWLIKHANPTTGRCDPGLRKLAFETGLSEKTIRRALKIAEDIGYLTVEPRFGHTSASHLDYRRMLADFHLIGEGAKRVSDSVRNSVEHHENPDTRVRTPGQRCPTYPGHCCPPKA